MTEQSKDLAIPEEYTYIGFDDGIGQGVWTCDNCGAYSATKETVKHHTFCRPGECKRWEKFYSEANAEEKAFEDTRDPEYNGEE